MTENKTVEYFMYELTVTYLVPIKLVGEDTKENLRKALEDAGDVDFDAPSHSLEEWIQIEEADYNHQKEAQ